MTKSIIVFGRHLDRTATTSRRSAGNGYTIISYGNYDIDGKIYGNISEVRKQYNEVNLGLLQSILQKEIRTVYQFTSSMKTEIDNSNLMILFLVFCQ